MPEERNFLYKEMEGELGKGPLTSIELPSYMTQNLKQKLFAWQKQALQYFLAYNDYDDADNGFLEEPTHLLFHMATGAGKTLLMAAAILYYYKEHNRRHFLFFVNQKAVVDKTESNFTDATHSKYLFADKVVIDNKAVAIRKVDTFSDNPHGIEIKFTTTQQLFSDVRTPKENQMTLEELQRLNVVMLADEAHHLSADTKKVKVKKDSDETKLTGSIAEREKKSWEGVIIDQILHKKGYVSRNNAPNCNVLLEFTATVPKVIGRRYDEKMIFHFPLQEFLQAGYTKQISLISSTLDKNQRILHALLFHWYRCQIALKPKHRRALPNFKPVILFRSKSVADSQQDYASFVKLVGDLSVKDFAFVKTMRQKIRKHKEGSFRTEAMLDLVEQTGVPAVVDFIRNYFTPKNIIITNSKSDATDAEKKLLNSLEDKVNSIRAIFTVQQLTEGWDVLNLFDIVRLYGEEQVAGKGRQQVVRATIQEKQLIGRGVRYYPFSLKPRAQQDRDINKRKFDNTKNELRVLEELFYYTYDQESQYITDLKQKLEEDGHAVGGDETAVEFRLKPQFKKSDAYKKTLWYNHLVRTSPQQKKRSFTKIKRAFSFDYTIVEDDYGETSVGSDKAAKTTKRKSRTLTLRFGEIKRHIVRKAVHRRVAESDVYRFENLCKKLSIKSMDELQSDSVLGGVELSIVSPVPKDKITNPQWLAIAEAFLQQMAVELRAQIPAETGSKFKPGNFPMLFKEPKTKYLQKAKAQKADAAKEVGYHWYALDKFAGTSEERACVQFIQEHIGNLEEIYDDVWLVRNEEAFKIYDDEGRGFQPDFLLFLKGKGNRRLYYQIFIEPKQGKLMTSKDEVWKQKFLLKIAEEHGSGTPLKAENRQYRLLGLPFFNEKKKAKFRRQFKALLLSDDAR